MYPEEYLRPHRGRDLLTMATETTAAGGFDDIRGSSRRTSPLTSAHKDNLHVKAGRATGLGEMRTYRMRFSPVIKGDGGHAA